MRLTDRTATEEGEVVLVIKCSLWNAQVGQWSAITNTSRSLWGFIWDDRICVWCVLRNLFQNIQVVLKLLVRTKHSVCVVGLITRVILNWISRSRIWWCGLEFGGCLGQCRRKLGGGGSWYKLPGPRFRLRCLCFCLSRFCHCLLIVQINLSNQTQVSLQLRVRAGQNYFFFCTPIIPFKDF